MAITRLRQAGLESDTTNSGAVEFDSFTGSALSTTSVKTGTYAMVCDYTNPLNASWNVTATRQLRTGFHYSHPDPLQTVNSGYSIRMFSTWSGSSEIVTVALKSTGQIGVYSAGSLVATSTVADQMRTYYHFGVDLKVDSSSGWVNVYRDGIPIVTYSGNTGNTDILTATYGAVASGIPFTKYQTGITGATFDDIFLDDTTGEAAAAVVPDKRFYSLIPNAAGGQYSQWTNSAGNSTNNYSYTDDRPHNSDTDYVKAASADLKDAYNISTYTLVGAETFAALIPFAIAKKSDAGIGSQIAIGSYRTSDSVGATQDLGTSYALRWERQTTKPAGGAWAQADLTAAQVLIVSKGVYA